MIAETAGMYIGRREIVAREAKRANEEGTAPVILFNLSGHGLIDMAAYDQYIAGDLANYEVTDEDVARTTDSLAKLI